jgi:uncharacterized membrane protein
MALFCFGIKWMRKSFQEIVYDDRLQKNDTQNKTIILNLPEKNPSIL